MTFLYWCVFGLPAAALVLIGVVAEGIGKIASVVEDACAAALNSLRENRPLPLARRDL